MKKSIALLLVLLLGIPVLAGCGNGGGQEAPATQGNEGEKGIEGKRVSLDISNEDTEKGVLSAVCPDGWYDHSNDEKLFFSESETPGDYARPYIQISYAPTAVLIGGSGEGIGFEMGGRNWEGLHNEEYNTYNVAHQLGIGGGLGVVSMGAGPEDAIYQLVVESIKVEF